MTVASDNARKRRPRAAVFSVAAVTVVAIPIYFVFHTTEPDRPRPPGSTRKSQAEPLNVQQSPEQRERAIAHARAIVERAMSQPPPVTFPRSDHLSYKVQMPREDDGWYKVSGHVDSRTDFAGRIRQAFTVRFKVKHRSVEEVQVVEIGDSLSFDEESPVWLQYTFEGASR